MCLCLGPHVGNLSRADVVYEGSIPIQGLCGGLLFILSHQRWSLCTSVWLCLNTELWYDLSKYKKPSTSDWESMWLRFTFSGSGSAHLDTPCPSLGNGAFSTRWSSGACHSSLAGQIANKGLALLSPGILGLVWLFSWGGEKWYSMISRKPLCCLLVFVYVWFLPKSLVLENSPVACEWMLCFVNI